MFNVDGLTQIVTIITALGGAGGLGAWLTYKLDRRRVELDASRSETDVTNLARNTLIEQLRAEIQRLAERVQHVEEQNAEMRAKWQEDRERLWDFEEENRRLNVLLSDAHGEIKSLQAELIVSDRTTKELKGTLAACPSCSAKFSGV